MRPPESSSPRAARAVVVALVAGYIGIYLCRKNLSVAMPLLKSAFSASRAEVGRIASLGTLCYAVGKLLLGQVVDRHGGRRGFLLSLFGVAFFGALAAFMPAVGLIALFYGANRLIGAAGWPAMMKLVPSWFPARRTASVVAVLSLSYVIGGAAAALFAQQVLAAGGGWRAVLGAPSVLLVLIALACARVVREGPLQPVTPAAPSARERSALATLLRRPQFILVCALSFALTLMREAFNTWSVDFLVSTEGGGASLASAALGSTSFDLAGALSILGMGVLYDRAPAALRRFLIAGVLLVLAAVLALLPSAGTRAPLLSVWLVGAVGLLVYGPYSLLAGVLAVESGGAALAASASGIIDAVGYLAGVLAGEGLGRLLDVGGYALGFHWLAAVTLVSAILALGLRPAPRGAEGH